jgi:hypothetical protein
VRFCPAFKTAEGAVTVGSTGFISIQPSFFQPPPQQACNKVAMAAALTKTFNF